MSSSGKGRDVNSFNLVHPAFSLPTLRWRSVKQCCRPHSLCATLAPGNSYDCVNSSVSVSHVNGGFFVTHEDLGERFDESIPTCTVVVFFKRR